MLEINLPKLSVNINKIATLRNARGGNNPDVLQIAFLCEQFGAQGITVHPRPDERHIRYSDVIQLAQHVTTEFNIEGYPSEEFLQLIERVKPHQVTLVPDPPDAITSNSGWDTIMHETALTPIIHRIKQTGTRVSIFLDPNPELIPSAKRTGTHRVELYTEAYAKAFESNSNNAATALEPYRLTAQAAVDAGKQEIALARAGLVEAGRPLLKDIEALGVKVVVPTASQREQFVSATRAVYTKWKPQIGNNLVAKAEKTLANVK